MWIKINKIQYRIKLILAMTETHISALSRNKSKFSNYFLNENVSTNIQSRIFKWAREEVIPLEIIKLFLLEEKHSL